MELTVNSALGRGNSAPVGQSEPDWISLALAAVVSYRTGFKEAGRRMVKQARLQATTLPPGDRRTGALSVCDMLLALDRRRFQRASALRSSAREFLMTCCESDAQLVRQIIEHADGLIRAP